jgi:hypothetical protein
MYIFHLHSLHAEASTKILFTKSAQDNHHQNAMTNRNTNRTMSILLILVIQVMMIMISTIHAGQMIPIDDRTVHKLTMYKNRFDDYVDVTIDEKVKKMMVNTTYIRYTVPIQVTARGHVANLIVDTTSSTVFMYCCAAPVIGNTTLCIASEECGPSKNHYYA